MTHESLEPVTHNHSGEASDLPTFLEQLKNQPDMLRIIENLLTNGLAKPVYKVKITTEKPKPKGDDALSRLESLVMPPEIKESLNLVGVFYSFRAK